MEEQEDSIHTNLVGEITVSAAELTLPSISGVAAGTVLTVVNDGSSWVNISGDCSFSPGVITVNPDYAIISSIEHIIDKEFEDRSSDCKQRMKAVFKSKTKEEQNSALRNMFTNQSLDFLREMGDNELINFLQISC